MPTTHPSPFTLLTPFTRLPFASPPTDKSNFIEMVKEEAAAEGEGRAEAKASRGRTKSFHISATDGDQDYQLMDPPEATAVIKVGALTKRGDVKKSWLKRYFVALNAANNFNVVYYDHEPDLAAFEPNAEGKVVPPKKGLKGTMKLAGYTVEKMSGEVGLKLTGGHEAQREWHFKCDSPQDVAEWIPVFQRAAKEAATPQHDDSVIHLSFMDAYKETRWSQSLWGSWHVWGAEDDMLGALLNDILQERLMSEIYDQVERSTCPSLHTARTSIHCRFLCPIRPRLTRTTPTPLTCRCPPGR